METKNKIFVLAFVLVLFVSCSKVNSINEGKQDQVLFIPQVDVEIIKGILSFQTKSDVDLFMIQVSSSNQKAVDVWESKVGFVSQRSLFNKVIELEDSVSDYFSNLPAVYQDFWRNQKPVHSKFYLNALSEGWIREVVEDDGNIYFDYNLYDNSMNSVVNKDGFVLVEGSIFQYTSNSIKTIVNGNFELVPILNKINTDYDDGNIKVQFKGEEILKTNNLIKSGVYPGYNWTKTILSPGAVVNNLPSNYKIDGSWVLWGYQTIGGYRKRSKVWIDGHSQRYGTNNTPDCNSAVSCTFTVRAEYMEKNFWGNWVYNNSQSFSLNASWAYSFGKYSDVTYGCGVSPSMFNYVTPYSCGGAVNCPISPYSNSWPSVNNAFINLTPHSTGYWYSNGPWFSHAFNVYQMNMSSSLGGISFNYSW